MDRDRILASHRRMLAAQLGVITDDPKKGTKGYEIKNLADGSAEIAVYDEIGPWGVSAVRFNDELRAINARSITLRIASPGGDVADGLAILNALRAHPAMINVIVEGWAASAASFIAMGGDTVQMAPNSMLMIHDAMTVCVGNAEEMLETAALLDKHSDNIADIYQRKAGGTVAEWRAKMREETWYTAQEAVDAGLADAIYGGAAKSDDGDADEDDAAQRPARANASAPRISNVMRQFDEGDRVQVVGTPHEPGHSQGVIDVVNGNAYGIIFDTPDDDTEPGEPYFWYVDNELEFVAEGADRQDGYGEGGSEQETEPEPEKEILPGDSHPMGRPVQTKETDRIEAAAVAVHHTATVDNSWDAGSQEKKLPSPMTVKAAKAMYAWYDAAQTDDGKLPKAACKFPHHEVDADGNPGAANLAACRNGLARLSSADIPESDQEAVRSHLQAHLNDAKGADNSASEVDMHMTPRLTEADLDAVRAALKTAAKEAKARG